MLMIQKYVLLQKAAQKILYGTLVKTPLLYSHNRVAQSMEIIPSGTNLCNINGTLYLMINIFF
jgi:hypothetical protein